MTMANLRIAWEVHPLTQSMVENPNQYVANKFN